MNLLYEDLARAQLRERLDRAHALRRARHLARSRRLAKRAERAERAERAAELHRARAIAVADGGLVVGSGKGGGAPSTPRSRTPYRRP